MSEPENRSDITELSTLIDEIRHDARWREEVSAYLAQRAVSTSPLRSLIGNDRLPFVPSIKTPAAFQPGPTVPTSDAGLNAAVDAIASAAGVLESRTDSAPDPQLVDILNLIQDAIKHADAPIQIESARPLIGNLSVALESFLHRRVRVSQDRQTAVNRAVYRSIQQLTDILGQPSVMYQPTINGQLVNALRSISRALDTSEPDRFASTTWTELAQIRLQLSSISSVLDQNSSMLSAALVENVNAIQTQVQSIARRIDHIETGWFDASVAVDKLAERLLTHIDAVNSTSGLEARMTILEDRLRLHADVDR